MRNCCPIIIRRMAHFYLRQKKYFTTQRWLKINAFFSFFCTNFAKPMHSYVEQKKSNLIDTDKEGV